mmetsp:Transcript_62316/g.172704  ORF Transcript_62316/g.172704 Transcript_62316/m.172704 type:complete len:232 (+) Transcript_62316:259-954(+)
MEVSSLPWRYCAEVACWLWPLREMAVTSRKGPSPPSLAAKPECCQAPGRTPLPANSSPSSLIFLCVFVLLTLLFAVLFIPAFFIRAGDDDELGRLPFERVKAPRRLCHQRQLVRIEAVGVGEVAVWVQRVHEERLVREQGPPDVLQGVGGGAALRPQHLDGLKVGKDLEDSHDLLGHVEALVIVAARLVQLLASVDDDELNKPVRGRRRHRGPGLLRRPPGHEADQHLHLL